MQACLSAQAEAQPEEVRAAQEPAEEEQAGPYTALHWHSNMSPWSPCMRACGVGGRARCGVCAQVRQRVIFDSDAPNARLIGVEYIISARLFDALPPEEQRLWHSHKCGTHAWIRDHCDGDSSCWAA